MRTLHLAALGLTLALAAAAAAEIVSATPRQLSLGTSFDVAGSGFGKHPSIWLDLEGRRIPLKIRRGATDAGFHATLTSLPRGAQGDCLLKVRPRGQRVAFSLAGMTIEPPAVDAVSPPSAGRLEQITIDGRFFGSRKGRVEFDGRPAKIRSWTDTRVTAVIPASVAPADVFLTIRNTAGVAQTTVYTVSE